LNTNLFPFEDEKNTATLTCECVFKYGQPILYVCHDEDDGTWQFLCGKFHNADEAMVVGLESVYHHDPSISTIAVLPLGYEAERENEKSDWKVQAK